MGAGEAGVILDILDGGTSTGVKLLAPGVEVCEQLI